MRARGSSASLLPLLVLTALVLGFVLLPPGSAARPEAPRPTLIVLGAAQYAGTPSPAFARRLDHALALYRAGGVRRIVVTGGRRPGDPHSEGGVGVGYLRTAGVPGSALIAETRSRTTIENLRGARVLLPPGTPVTLVTDAAHTPRALALARALEMDAAADPSPLSARPDRRYLLRERLALVAYAVVGVR
ncbi:YdcF family protein [Deinococcus sp. MIMF12]|uniref:YdcF family protein n=1 Tax=Deinococcus rhizophilus TaxID=3049544 RepID=A0ABT7JC67_9DEIO|nr:YdcF family protein [Deinococcus rhizophilus]MDL2342627.1 YdcF family protein [Deinococcus rhizophilus]